MGWLLALIGWGVAAPHRVDVLHKHPAVLRLRSKRHLLATCPS